MFDLLISAHTVITMDEDRRVLRDGWVGIEAGGIAAVGTGAPPPARSTLDHPAGIALPGLVDAHGHAGHSLLRTIGDDDLSLWLEACRQIYLHASTPEFWRADARLTALERILAGTTTGLSMLGGAGDTIRCDDPAYANAHIEGAAAVGLRDVVVIGPGAPPFPKTTTDARTEEVVTSDFDDQMAVVDVVRSRWHGAHDRRTQVALTFPTFSMAELGPIAAEDLADAAAHVATYAEQHQLLIVQDGHRGDSVEASDRLGLLGPRTLLSHAVDLDAGHIDLLRRRASAVAHNPNAIYSMFGRCPVPELIEAGVTVGLGSDGTGPDRSSDMFRHMFGATRHHRTERRDPAFLPAGTVLEMATVGAAKALGLDAEIGSLEAGKAADIIVVDGHRPHLTPLVSPVHQIVYYANGNDVDTVVVAGEPVVVDGNPTAVSSAEIIEEARREHRAALERSGLGSGGGSRPGMWGGVRYDDGSGITGL